VSISHFDPLLTSHDIPKLSEPARHGAIRMRTAPRDRRLLSSAAWDQNGAAARSALAADPS
jgi:hypothetical protein